MVTAECSASLDTQLPQDTQRLSGLLKKPPTCPPQKTEQYLHNCFLYADGKPNFMFSGWKSSREMLSFRVSNITNASTCGDNFFGEKKQNRTPSFTLLSWEPGDTPHSAIIYPYWWPLQMMGDWEMGRVRLNDQCQVLSIFIISRTH